MTNWKPPMNADERRLKIGSLSALICVHLRLKMLLSRFLFACCLPAAVALAQAGPPHGSLVIIGGGKIGPEIMQRFTALAGGPDAPVVVIPTASEQEQPPATYRLDGFRQVTVLHTRDRKVADSEAFVAPLRKARGVFFPGGRQWRLADAYLGTLTEKELHALLDRGGVIGGTSAGATIQGSYLVRGAPEGNLIMMAKGHEQGFGFLKLVAIDQHLIARHREKDMLKVVGAHPELLGIGIDESTAVVVQGDRFEVVGQSKVAIYDPQSGKPYYFLSPGDRFNLRTRSIE
jgi:cyanophycinase